MRDGEIRRDPDPIDVAAPGLGPAEIAELEGERDRVAEADEIIRGLTKLRRYARSLHRQMKWYIDQFHVEHPDRWDDPMRLPAFVIRALIRDENARKPRWSFKPSSPEFCETNPFGAAPPTADPAAYESDMEVTHSTRWSRVGWHPMPKTAVVQATG